MSVSLSFQHDFVSFHLVNILEFQIKMKKMQKIKNFFQALCYQCMLGSFVFCGRDACNHSGRSGKQQGWPTPDSSNTFSSSLRVHCVCVLDYC